MSDQQMSGKESSLTEIWLMTQKVRMVWREDGQVVFGPPKMPYEVFLKFWRGLPLFRVTFLLGSCLHLFIEMRQENHIS